jgi:hypothetical protein
VHISTTQEQMADMPFAPDDRVNVTLSNGTTLAHEPIARPKGSWQKPLSEDELREKFMDCAGTALSDAQAALLFERLAALDRLDSLRELPLVSNWGPRRASKREGSRGPRTSARFKH